MDCGWYQDAGVDFTSLDAARYEADFRDDRISATIAIDPALPQAMTEISLRDMEHPSLIINFGLRDKIPAGVRADRIAATMPNALYVSAREAWHFSEINACNWLGWIIIGASGLLTEKTTSAQMQGEHAKMFSARFSNQSSPLRRSISRATKSGAAV